MTQPPYPTKMLRSHRQTQPSYVGCVGVSDACRTGARLFPDFHIENHAIVVGQNTVADHARSGSNGN